MERTFAIILVGLAAAALFVGLVSVVLVAADVSGPFPLFYPDRTVAYLFG